MTSAAGADLRAGTLRKRPFIKRKHLRAFQRIPDPLHMDEDSGFHARQVRILVMMMGRQRGRHDPAATRYRMESRTVTFRIASAARSGLPSHVKSPASIVIRNRKRINGDKRQ